ncbi:MAG TPA: 50S ribosomal protein L29 [Cytophagaceae bacterium]|jgi:large subunit ribosomal protein L29|nr:50S ribosomal protein L29 [Cytophagaceae bacterium]
MKKKVNIQDLSVEELNTQIAAEEENLRRLKFGHAVSPIENPMKIRETKKVVARLKTVLHAKQQ